MNGSLPGIILRRPHPGCGAGRAGMLSGQVGQIITAGRADPRAGRVGRTGMFEVSKIEDADPGETREWLESIDSVLKVHGAERAHYLLERLIDHTRRSGAYLPFKPNTAYVNSISTA